MFDLRKHDEHDESIDIFGIMYKTPLKSNINEVSSILNTDLLSLYASSLELLITSYLRRIVYWEEA